MACLLFSSAVAAAAGRPARVAASATSDQPGRLIPIAEDAGIERIEADAPVTSPGRDAPVLIYSNTAQQGPLGDPAMRFVFARGAGMRVADDLETTAIDTCALYGFEVAVSGGVGVEDQDKGTFDVTLALWDGCPGSGGQIIPGTERTFATLPDRNDVILVLPVAVGDDSIALPPHVWVSGVFSTDTSGFVVGSPAEMGYSADRYDDPFIPCRATFGHGYPLSPHASVYARVFARPPCKTHFAVYRAGDPFVSPGATLALGDDVRGADDIELAIGDDESCELSAYELFTRGAGGFYTLRIDLRHQNLAGPIPGTAFVSLGNPGDGDINTARYIAPPGVFIPKNSWLSWQADRNETGVVAGGTPSLGASTPRYARFDEATVQWRLLNDITGTDAVAGAVIYCRGTRPVIPTGACCKRLSEGGSRVCLDHRYEFECPAGYWAEGARCEDDPFDPPCGAGACCRVIDNESPPVCIDDMDEAQCADGRWREGVKCSAESFDPPCGVSACCTPDGCEDLSPEACWAITDDQGHPSIWQPGELCGLDGQECFNFACYYSTQDCFSGHDVTPLCTSDEACFSLGLGPCTCGDGSRPPCAVGVAACEFKRGCSDPECCNKVCDADSTCCGSPHGGWDSTCAELAGYQQFCGQRPHNDQCAHEVWPDFGAEPLVFDEEGHAAAEVSLEFATEGSRLMPEPPLCCNKLGVDTPGRGSVWYYFIAHYSSVRITTCGSDADARADSIIQVFDVSTDDFHIEPMCRSLEPITCNDDAGATCRDANGDPQPFNSDLCVRGLVRGRPYFVLLAASTDANKQPSYRLRLESPCPHMNEIPSSGTCTKSPLLEAPITAPAESILDVPFDLSDAPFRCPGEPCVKAMINNVWWHIWSPCAGFLHIDTCEDTSSGFPDTTLAVYENTHDIYFPCPSQGGELLACNDDAEATSQEHAYHDQFCSLSGISCDTSEDCEIIHTCSRTRRCRQESTTTCIADGDCLPGDECAPPIDCNADADCPVDAVCRDEGFRGTCSISGRLCRDSFDCRVGACHENRDPCVLGVPESCRKVCSGSGNVCVTDSNCNPPGPSGQTCEPQVCERAESCVMDRCLSSCGKASSLTVPVNFNQVYAIRLGGEHGSEPSGTLTLRCIHNDCNQNGIADIKEPDCNENDIPDQCDVNINDPDGDGKVSLDADDNGIPDECQPLPCPDGSITFLDPETLTAFATQPPDITDAGQPHAVDDAGSPQGIDMLPVSTSVAIDRVECWSLCETDAAGTNAIEDIVAEADGLYVIKLAQPLRPGATTTLTYRSTTSDTFITARFTALPGDIDGDGTVGIADIGALLDCLNGVTDCAAQQCDIDRIPPCAPADLGRLVDLLVGGGAFSWWLNVHVNDEHRCPAH